jgi:hypothetical protein
MKAIQKSASVAAAITGERRLTERRMVDEASTLRGPDQHPLDVMVSDLSRSGFKVLSDRELPLGAIVHLGLPGTGRLAARVVRRSGDRYGCEFVEYLSHDQVADAFGQSTVAPLFIASSQWQAVEDEVTRWPRAVRTAIAVGGALLAWWAIFRLII